MTVRPGSVAQQHEAVTSGRTASVLLDIGPGQAGPLAGLVHQMLGACPDLQVVRSQRAALPDVTMLGSVDVVIACASSLPDERWQELDARCEAAGRAWHRAYPDATAWCVGPFTAPGVSAGYRDLRARRLAASRHPQRLLEHWARLDPMRAPQPSGDQASVERAVELLVNDVLAHLRGDRVIGADHEVRVEQMAITRHRVLPLPGRGIRSATPGPGVAEDDLVDVRTGLVTSLEVRSAGPYASSLTCVEAQVADTRWFAPWRADPITSGATLGDPPRARRAALGEAIERYCGNAVPADLVHGSAEELTALGHRVTPLAEFALYSSAQYATPGFPFVPLHERLALDWTRGRELAAGTPVLVPAAAVYLNGPGTRPGDPVPISPPALAGIAAGETTAIAERAALEEVIERDAVTIWWTSGAPATELDVAGDPVIGDALAGTIGVRLDARFLLLPCLFDVPVVAVLLRDTANQLIGFGTACRSSTVEAARKALAEALVSLEVAGELADDGGAFWTDVRAGRLAAEPYRPLRADRAYREQFRADWRDLTSLEPNVQLYLDPQMQHIVEQRTSGVRSAIPLAAGPDVLGDPRSEYLRALTEQGLNAVGVDMTTDDVAQAGLRVSRVVVPGLYQLAPAAFPLLGGTRLYQQPVQRGWVAPFDESDVVCAPLPFS